MSQVNAKTLMLGKNADPAKNFKITVPTPEDGTIRLVRGDNTLLTNYADDAAAATGGVPVGGLYRTGSALKVRVA